MGEESATGCGRPRGVPLVVEACLRGELAIGALFARALMALLLAGEEP